MKRLLFLGLLFSFTGVMAQENTIVTDTTAVLTAVEKQETTGPLEFWHGRRFRVFAGLYAPLNNTKIRVGSENGDYGTTIDLEDDLGFSDYTFSAVAGIQWRISRRSRLDFEHFYINRKSTRTLDKEIEFRDHTYPVYAKVTAFFDTNISRLAYGYAFVSRPKYEIGALVGAHVIFGDIGLNLDTSIGEAQVSDNFNFTAPLPDFGLWSEIVLTPKLGLNVNVNYLAIKVNDFEGRLISYNLSVLWNIYRDLSFTLGYTGLNFRVDMEKERVNGYFKWGYNGPMLTACYSFGGHVRLQKKNK
jgi:hypothetical protein